MVFLLQMEVHRKRQSDLFPAVMLQISQKLRSFSRNPISAFRDRCTETLPQEVQNCFETWPIVDHNCACDNWSLMKPQSAEDKEKVARMDTTYCI